MIRSLSLEKIRRLAISNAMAYNKYFTKEYLEKKTTRQLINNCHPETKEELLKSYNMLNFDE